MSEYTDRTAAVTAALQDLARDLEADLGKLARWRGATESTPGGTGSPARFRDPGPNVASFTGQREANPARGPLIRRQVLISYGAAAQTALAMVHVNAPTGEELAARTDVMSLVEAIQNVRTHDDAVALVATFV